MTTPGGKQAVQRVVSCITRSVSRCSVSVSVQWMIDAVFLAGAFVLANLLRHDFAVPAGYWPTVYLQMPLVVALQVLALFFSGAYRFVWRYIGMLEVPTFVLAAASSAIPLLVMRFFFTSGMLAQDMFWKISIPEVGTFPVLIRVPGSIIFMDTLLGFGMVFGLRVLRRAIYERHEKEEHRDRALLERGKAGEPAPRQQESVLLIGAGQAGGMAAREIAHRGHPDFVVRGFLDDDLKKQGTVIHGIPVLGGTEMLPEYVKKYGITQVIITMANASRKDITRIVTCSEQAGVKTRIIPGLYEILDGQIEINRIRDVQIEDLLGRDEVVLDGSNLQGVLCGKCLMVTGAGGSIGSEMLRQAARFKPSRLLLVERSEFALYEIHRELRRVYPDLDVVPLLADIGDETRMRELFDTYHPVVVIHAAAHKHVPMMECNPREAIKNNVLATRRVGELAGQSGVEVFIMISTDKAVNPVSVMGASKRLAEIVIQDLNGQYTTRFVAVRFGNVLGSTGSVIPLFREQIREGGPVTVTHPDVIRYFMTIPEAARLVLQAGAMGRGGEIFILDMGEPVRIVDLAQDMIRLSGLEPGRDIEIVFTGLRPGEKMFEELQTGAEKATRTRHPKILIGQIPAYPRDKVVGMLTQLAVISRGQSEKELRQSLNAMLPEAKIAS